MIIEVLFASLPVFINASGATDKFSGLFQHIHIFYDNNAWTLILANLENSEINEKKKVLPLNVTSTNNLP